MPRQNLFEYVILHHPKPQRDAHGFEEPTKSTIVKEPSYVLSVTEQEVTITAARAIPEEYLDRLDQIEIRVRPF